MLVYIVNGNEKHSKDYDDFGDKLSQKRRLIFDTKDVKEKSLFERLSQVKDNFEKFNQNSRAIDYATEKTFQGRAPTREELIKKLKFDLQPKATIYNQTIIVDGLSVSTNQSPPSLSSLPFDRKLLNQLGTLLPGGRSRDSVKDIHAELQGMLFGDDSVITNEEDYKNTETVQTYTKIDGGRRNSTSTEVDADVTFYDLMDYTDYTDDIDSEYEQDEKIELIDSTHDEDEVDDFTSMDEVDQAAEESIHYNRKVPINFLNMSSSSLPLVGNRRQDSFVRFPERQIQKQNMKMPLKSRLRNKQRRLHQQLQKDNISSRIVSRKPNRNRYKPEAKLAQNDYGLDYEEINLRRQDRINRNKLNEKKNQRTNQRIQNQDNRKTFITNGKNQNLLPLKKNIQANIRDCDYYTNNLCLNVANYPKEEIILLLSGRNRRVGTDLIADVLDQSADELIDGVTSAQENSYTISHYFGPAERREDTKGRPNNDPASVRDFAQDGGFLCPSEIKYAKPKRGKTAQGVWKDIVNVNDYTQTLRMEKCLKPGGGCSYVSHHYRSQCSQIYNYHRLLSWDKSRGLHMDIYKVPTCCSCHIMGYSYVYPPLSKGEKKRKEAKQTPAQYRSDDSALPLASQRHKMQRKKPLVSIQAVRTENTPKHKIFPELGPPDLGGFKNFMSQMNNKFPFQIAKKRDGLVATSAPRKNAQQASRNENPVKIKNQASQNIRAKHSSPPLNYRIKPSRQMPHKQNVRPGILGDARRSLITKRKQQTSSQGKRDGQNFNKPKLMPPMNKLANRLPAPQKDMSPRKVERNKVNLLDRPRSHNASKDVPKVRYQSIILEEPVESENDKKSKDTNPSKKEKKDNGDKDPNLPRSSSVNYGYHPIIDFFPRYRFDASRK